MNNQITYDDKVALNDNPLIPDINKCKADDMNEIKNKHNGCMNGSIPMGNVVVDSIRSKNVLNYYVSERTNFGIKMSIDSTKLFMDGTTTGAGLIYYVTSNTFKLKAGTYTFSSSILSGSFTRNSQDIGVYIRNENTNAIIFETTGAGNYTNNTTITLNEDTPIIIYLNGSGSGFVASNLTIGFQIEKGNTATSYSPYQNLTGEEIYSTNEVRIGTWINGKNLYRKVYNFGQLPNASVKGMALNISNLDEITSIRGICKNETADYTTVIPQVDASNVSTQLQVYVQDNEVKVYTAGNKSAYTKSYIVIEYTKTTD